MNEDLNDFPTERAPAPAPEKTALRFPISSYELKQDVPHVIGNPSLGIEGFFLNTEHEQDAFAIQGDAIVVCDGVSMEPHSAVFSSSLAHIMAKEIQESGLHVAVSESLVGAVADLTWQVPSVEKSEETGFATTFVALQIHRMAKEIHFKSKGDSPLFVIDYAEDGSMEGFDIVNDDWPIDNETYTKLSNILHLRNPAADATGVTHEGVKLLGLESMKEGVIEHKNGRVVVVGTDFLTKMLLASPEGMAARIANEKDSNRRYDLESVEPEYAKMTEVFVTNPVTGKQMFNPAFFRGKGKGELAILLERWKKVAGMGQDDATMIALDMDRLFGTQP
jgi:hypothetical protein